LHSLPAVAAVVTLAPGCYASLTFVAASVWSLPADVAPTPGRVA
jgi:hypothetical protein